MEKIIEEEKLKEDEIKTLEEDKESSYLPNYVTCEELFFKVVYEVYKKIIEYVKREDIYGAIDLAHLLEILGERDVEKELKLVMNVLDKISNKRY